MAQNQPTVVNFASVRKFEYPDFLDIQLKSFQDFFQIETNPDNRLDEGLFKVFKENFPISDARNNFTLEFLDYYIERRENTTLLLTTLLLRSYRYTRRRPESLCRSDDW